MKRIKFSKIILLSFFLSVFAINTSAQKVTLSFKNESFEKVLNAIKQQTNLSPVFSEQIVDLNRKVTINVNSVPVEEALNQLLTGTNVEFEIKNAKLYLIEKKATQKQVAPAKSKKVSGVITDAKGEAIIGATVLVVGQSTGSITNFDGRFDLELTADDKLQISYIGYATQTVAVGNNTALNIVLLEDSKQIEEVVVVAYGTQKKSHLTGAIASLKNDNLDEIAVSRVDQALQGKLAGLQIINTSPEAGEKPQIRIRGLGSISASSEPLVVIDGFPIEDGLSMISMGDVESIEVLKDAASSALYGSRAAGGVILITTKSGNMRRPKYSFKMFTGISSVIKLPEILNANEYIEMMQREAEMRKLDPSVNGVQNQTMLFNRLTDPERSMYLIQKYMVDQPTNWLEEGLRNNGTIKNYQLSASGGDKNIRYYISGNFSGEEGVMKKSTFDRYNFRIKTDITLSNKITLGVNISPTYMRQERPAGDLTDYMRFPSWMPIRHNEATASLTNKKAGDYAQPSDFNGINISGVGWGGETWNLTGVSPFNSSNQNPVSIRERSSNIIDQYRLQANAYLNIDFQNGFQFRTSNGVFAGYREENLKEQTSAKKEGNPNVLTRELTFITDLLSENTLTYDKKWAGHEVNVLGGITFQKTTEKYNRIVGTHFPDEEILSYNYATQLVLNSGSLPGTTSFYFSDALMSLLGRVTYAYQGKYLASVSFRSDGSSKFGPGHKWGSFPAASIGWRPSEESFMKQFDWLSNLKIRASYGLTGNNKIPQYAYMNLVNSTNYVVGNGTGVLTPGMASNSDALGNPELTWEQLAEANYGIDFGFFNSKINVSVEHYNSNTVQLLLKQPAMLITGHNSYWNNIGKVNNKGWEIEVSTTNITNRRFTWKTNANLSTNKNTLLNYGNKEREDRTGERNEVYRAEIGKPSIQYYGYKTVGVWTTFEEVAEAKAMKDADGNPFVYSKFQPVVGGLKVANTNGDNRIDADDRVVLGNPFPDFTWGITNTFTYKNFDLSFLFQGVQGIDLINGNVYYNEQLRFNKAYVNNRYVSPMFPGDGQTTYFNTTSGNDLLLTDYVIEDGSYASLRDFTFGYKIPANLLKKIKINDMRFYFSGQNLLYFMAPGYKGINPEARRTSAQYEDPLIQGYQRGAFPLNRSYTVGFDLTF